LLTAPACPELDLHSVQVIITAALGGYLYGFSANAIAGTLAQPSFIAKFLTVPDAAARTDGLLGG
jgi:hypothetical protein